MKLNKYKILLLGFNSELDKIKLNDGITIRKGITQELKDFYEKIIYDNLKNQQFIIEYESEEENNVGTFPRKLLKLIDELNLFFEIFFDGHTKVAHAFRYVWADNEYKRAGFISNPNVSTYFEKEYILRPDDLEKIKDYWGKYQLQSENQTMQIALRRYLFSIQKHDKEDKVIDLIIAFEALLIKENERSIREKIAIRCSKFLSDECDQEKVYDFLQKTYKLRSEIVHGSSFELNAMNSKEKYFHLGKTISILSELMRYCFQKKILEFTNLSSTEFIEELMRISATG